MLSYGVGEDRGSLRETEFFTDRTRNISSRSGAHRFRPLDHVNTGYINLDLSIVQCTCEGLDAARKGKRRG